MGWGLGKELQSEVFQHRNAVHLRFQHRVRSLTITFYFLHALSVQETRRRQLAEAAEQRQKANEGRGVKDPEALKRKQQRKEELERKAESQPQADSGPGLRVSAFFRCYQPVQLIEMLSACTAY